MTGFEPRTSGVGSNRSTNWATTAASKNNFCLKRKQITTWVDVLGSFSPRTYQWLIIFLNLARLVFITSRPELQIFLGHFLSLRGRVREREKGFNYKWFQFRWKMLWYKNENFQRNLKLQEEKKSQEVKVLISDPITVGFKIRGMEYIEHESYNTFRISKQTPNLLASTYYIDVVSFKKS